MKKTILLAFIITLWFQFSFSQNPVAKLKYEEAEKAYSLNNFELAITKLNEAETLLKATNPKLLYLKVMSQSKMIEQNPLGDYTLIETARKSAGKYLRDYEKLPNNEDHYRDIYKIGETLKSYPISTQDFENAKKQNEIKIAESKTAELNKQKKIDEAFSDYIYFKGFKLGLTVEETIKAYPSFKRHYKNKAVNSNEYEYSITEKNGYGFGNLKSFMIKNNKTIGYAGNLYGSIIDDRTYDDEVSNKLLSEVKMELINELNFSPEVVSTETPISGYISNNKTTYTWKKNNKSVELVHTRLVEGNGDIHHSIFISSLDQNLAN